MFDPIRLYVVCARTTIPPQSSPPPTAPQAPPPTTAATIANDPASAPPQPQVAAVVDDGCGGRWRQLRRSLATVAVVVDHGCGPASAPQCRNRPQTVATGRLRRPQPPARGGRNRPPAPAATARQRRPQPPACGGRKICLRRSERRRRHLPPSPRRKKPLAAPQPPNHYSEHCPDAPARVLPLLANEVLRHNPVPLPCKTTLTLLYQQHHAADASTPSTCFSTARSRRLHARPARHHPRVGDPGIVFLQFHPSESFAFRKLHVHQQPPPATIAKQMLITKPRMKDAEKRRPPGSGLAWPASQSPRCI